MEELNDILYGSKQYKFEDGENGTTVLKITGYYTGKSIKLDLSKLTDKTLKEIIVEDDDDEDY